MKYKKHIPFIFVLSSTISIAQNAFYNTGNVQLHTGAQIGFHTDVINDGVLDNYVGFAGFYADNEVRIISGTNRITFFDVEIDALQNLELQNSLGVRNQLDFINGQVITPRNNTNIRLDFINHDMYAGEDNDRHVNGYSSIKFGARNSNFTFPIGDGTMLRPMSIPNANKFYLFNGAYFYEDPNTPSTFTASFLTDQKQAIIENISNLEFWDLDGNNETRVTLTWNSRSDIASLANNISQLIVVGWSKTENQWVNLDVLEVTGNLSEGTITSAAFVPNNYEVITIGSLLSDEVDSGNNNNILISPNGDNLNEVLIFDEVNEFAHNKLTIYNRWGNIVYATEDYKNDWDGTSNGRAIFNKQEKLPAATYFYYLELGDEPNTYQKLKKGWVYITR